jgi:Fe-S-cluster containining protein
MSRPAIETDTGVLPPATPDPGRYRTDLHAIYAEVDAEVARLGPVCQLSGRCCRFDEYGHTLFVSAPEAALLVAEAPPPVRPLDDGATCPWQDARGHCTARAARPLGCRVYYCDPTYEGQAEALSETFIGRLKRMADENRLPWDYAPLHRHLHQAVADGRLVADARTIT